MREREAKVVRDGQKKDKALLENTLRLSLSLNAYRYEEAWRVVPTSAHKESSPRDYEGRQSR